VKRATSAICCGTAQAAARLTLERALADLGVTPPQFVVLTMLKAYPGLSGADLARVALLTPQTVGVIIRNLEREADRVPVRRERIENAGAGPRLTSRRHNLKVP